MTKSTNNPNFMREIPTGKRSRAYRFWEMIVPLLTLTVLLLCIILSWINPLCGALYVLVIVVFVFVKGVAIAISTIKGKKRMDKAMVVDWHQRLLDLEEGRPFHGDQQEFGYQDHLDKIAYYQAEDSDCPRVDQVYNLVIVAAYNEPFEVIDTTIGYVLDSFYNKQQMIICLAYEQRGGEAMAKTAKKLTDKYKSKFFDFVAIEHPAGMPNEVIGKGGNITFAGKEMSKYCRDKGIDSKDVLVTTLDCDNKPHFTYFDNITYEFITNVERKYLSYQPIAVFTGNVWDVPAPMRVIAFTNSFWNIISTTRQHSLRNFASHAQPLDALEEMDFWSTRTVVEDGHQFWRSYFHFKGNYAVLPISVPIYQDAVIADNYFKSLKAQFIQLRRWSYGVSDVPYVATNVWRMRRELPLFDAVAKLIRLMEGFVSQATSPLLIAFGGWVPLLVSRLSYRSFAAHQLPTTVATIQQIAMIALVATIFLSLQMLPPRPRRYRRSREIGMLLQWVLVPATAVFYASFTALNAQMRLLSGKYLDKFDVTEKKVVDDNTGKNSKKADKAKAQTEDGSKTATSEDDK